jgi:hypothetical protein
MPGEPKNCEGCGAPLPETLDTSVVRCAYCGKTQPNPQPLPIGQEVLLRGGAFGSTLGRVVSCQGPERIEIEVEQRREIRRLDDLTPVCALPPDARRGDRVFVDHGDFDWHATWLVSAEGARCVVKHEDESFHDAFFDKKVALSGVRVPMRKAERVRQRGALWSSGKPLAVIGVLMGFGYMALSMYFGC